MDDEDGPTPPEEPRRPDPRDANRRDPKGIHAEAWERTLEELEALAADRREEGWDVTTCFAAHTDTVSVSMGDNDRFGLVHVLPDNHADRFEAAYDPDAFTEYLAYGQLVDTSMYVVTELIDPDAERSIMVASQYNMAFADGMIASAETEGYLPSHFKTIDGTVVGTFEHEEYDPLITRPGG